MGARGPGSGRLKAVAALATQVAFPWEKEGMPRDEQMIAFLESLPIVSGLRAGERMELIDFQREFVRKVYGPSDDKGDRLVRLAALSVARGNGKSGLLAGLGIGHLMGPMAEPYGECYAAALDREQASVLYRMTCAFIYETPWMAARVNIRDQLKEITDHETGSIWRALTSDARKAHGLAPSFWVADEVAQWRSRELWDNLATGMGKRASALGITISTQAADDLHFFSEMLDAEPVPTVYTQLHAAPDDCALDDREAWKAANPALGQFLNADQFADAAARAMRSASFAPSFRLLQLNQRIAAEDRFINPVEWEANGEPFDVEELEGKRCFGGLDLSSVRDLCAFALYFPDEGKLLAWHFVPKDTIAERVERDRVPYDRWAETAEITVTPGRATDRASIVRVLDQVQRAFDLQGIAFDAWRFEDLDKMLIDEGVELPLVKFVTGMKSYTPAMDAFERAVIERRMRHNNSPILKWQAGNVVVDTDPAGNRKPAKDKSFDRIDGIVAAIMACGLAYSNDPSPISNDDWLARLAASAASA